MFCIDQWKLRVVAEHKGQQVLLPFQGGGVDIGGEVLGESFVGDFSLTVGLRMSGSGVNVLHSEVLEELFCHSGSELLACVYNEVNIFGKGIHDAQDVLLSGCGGFEGPKQIGMDLLIWLCRSWQLGHSVKDQGSSAMTHLAPVAALDVGSDYLGLGWAGCLGLGPGSWIGAPRSLVFEGVWPCF